MGQGKEKPTVFCWPRGPETNGKKKVSRKYHAKTRSSHGQPPFEGGGEESNRKRMQISRGKREGAGEEWLPVT